MAVSCWFNFHWEINLCMYDVCIYVCMYTYKLNCNQFPFDGIETKDERIVMLSTENLTRKESLVLLTNFVYTFVNIANQELHSKIRQFSIDRTAQISFPSFFPFPDFFSYTSSIQENGTFSE